MVVTGDFDPGLLPPGLLEGYLRSVQGQIEHLAGLADRLATDGTDPKALDEFRRESHKIRGSAGSYGFAEATRVAAEMETMRGRRGKKSSTCALRRMNPRAPSPGPIS